MDFPTVVSAGDERVLNVRADAPDIRDRIYEPALVRLESKIDNREPGLVLNQAKKVPVPDSVSPR